MHARHAHSLRARSPAPGGRSDGYTIVEVVLVIVILGVIGAAAGPRFFDSSVFEERAYYDELTSALRYAQKIAVASGCPVRVDIGVTSYALAQQAVSSGHCDAGDTGFPVPVRLPTGEIMSGNAPTGITTAPSMVVVYTALGSTTLGANQAIGIGSRSLTIQAESGLVVTQ